MTPGQLLDSVRTNQWLGETLDHAMQETRQRLAEVDAIEEAHAWGGRITIPPELHQAAEAARKTMHARLARLTREQAKHQANREKAAALIREWEGEECTRRTEEMARKILTAYYLEGKSTEEIAEDLFYSSGRIRQILRQSKDSINRQARRKAKVEKEAKDQGKP